MSKEPWDWTREDLEQLIGETENLRLEFKSSRLLTKSADNIAQDLSVEVSAFANTEGGTLVIGMEEIKVGKARRAERLDAGMDISTWSPEKLQRLIEANVRPYLTGLRVKAIPLTQGRTSFAFVVAVPVGNTAYQASDWRYYGRSEYEAKPLPDHEIRLRMSRGRAPDARIQLLNLRRSLIQKPKVAADAIDRLSHLEIFSGDQGQELIETYTFDLALVNTGEINIAEFKVHVDYAPENLSQHPRRDWSFKDGWSDETWGSYVRGQQPTPSMQKVNVFPRDTFRAAQASIFWPVPGAVHPEVAFLNWTLYLSNTLPIQGEIDLGTEILNSQKAFA